MTTNFHTAIDGTCYYNKASDIEGRLSDLDQGITDNAAAIVANSAAITALSQIVVVDRDLTSPPGSPSSGDTYIPAATASGDWAGYEDYVTYWDGDEWVFVEPQEGWLAWIVDEGISCVYTDSGWAEDTPTPGDHTHVEADITDLDKYTQSEVDTALSAKSDTTHNHNLADLTEKSYDNLDDLPDLSYIINFYQPGVMSDGWSITLNFSETVTFPSGLTDSVITGEEASATAETTISIKKDSTEIGTAVFAASGSTATITFSSEQTFTKGTNKITFAGPATADATLAGLSVSMKGSR